LPEAAVGRGAVIHDGTDALLLAYGPVMLHEALTAAELLDGRLQVVNMPWLNRVDVEWVSELAEPFGDVFVLEDHAPVGALGDSVRRALGRARGNGLRRRGLACVRDAGRGPALPRPRRRFACRPHCARAARPRELVTPVWLVLPDPFSTRLFFDTGIVEKLHARLGDRLELVVEDGAAGWTARAPGVRTTTATISSRCRRRPSNGCGAGSTGGSTGESASIPCRCGTACATASTVSACGPVTRTGSSTRPSQGRSHAGACSTG
jgi:hypothetical protein